MTFDKKKYMKEYNSRPEVKKRLREYYLKPRVKKKKREYRRKYVALSIFSENFFKHFSRNISCKDDLIYLSKLYSETACNFSKRKQCLLQEKILLDASKYKLRLEDDLKELKA